MTLFSDKENSTGPFLNPSRWLRQTFVSFAQGLFFRYPAFQWSPDRTKTKVVIQDKFVENNVNPEKMPLITFSRGAYQLQKISIDGVIDLKSSDNRAPQTQSDIARSSGTFSCEANTIASSEHMADLLAAGIHSYRDLLKQNGIKNIIGVSVGETSPVKMDTNGNRILTFNTPVFFQFEYQFFYCKNVDYDYATHVAYDITISGYPDYNMEGIEFENSSSI